VPAPKYQEWKTVETLVLALKEKEGVTPYVIGAGVPYGNGEECLYDIFKSAWLGRQTFRFLAPGNNFIPTVHTRDLARLVRNVVVEKPQKSYFLAVDRGNSTQKEIVSTIVTNMSDLSADFPVIGPEQAVLAEFTDIMTLDLRMEPSSLMTSDNFRWWSEEGMTANFQKVADEFNRWRRLQPIRVLLVGPPGSGAEQLADLLSENYRLEPQRFDVLMDQAAQGESDKNAELREKLREISEIANDPKKAAGGVPDVPIDMLKTIMEDGLESKVACRFRGWALTGFPLSIKEAEEFLLEDPPQEEPVDGEDTAADPPPDPDAAPPPKVPREKFCPQHIFILNNGDQEKCLERAKGESPETFNEMEFKRKTEKYNKTNLGEEGNNNLLADWFKENLPQSIVYDPIDVAQVIEEDGTLESIASQMFEKMEEKELPFNFLPVIRKAAEQVVEEVKEDIDAAAREEELKALEREQQRKDEENERIEKIKKDEQHLLEENSKQLRQYLTAFVVPTLTQGLIEVCQEQPADPVDYLAEYLFAFHSRSQPPILPAEEAAA